MPVVGGKMDKWEKFLLEVKNDFLALLIGMKKSENRYTNLYALNGAQKWGMTDSQFLL